MSKIEYEKGKRPIIVGLRPNMWEKGKIKIGKKGGWKTSSSGKEYQMPEKQDYFTVTTLERDPKNQNFIRDEKIHKMLEKQYGTEKITRIPIMFLFNEVEMNFQCRYAYFRGRKQYCAGDGEKAFRIQEDDKKKQIDCLCQFLEPNAKGEARCKMNGTLSVVIQNTDVVGGIWKFRTTSRNTIQALYSSLMFFKNATLGHLAGVPFDLVISPKIAVTPIDGKTQKIYVVGLEYNGNVDDLRGETLIRIESTAQYQNAIAEIEKATRKQLESGYVEEEVDDFVDEFVPEDGMKVDKKTGEIKEKPNETKKEKEPEKKKKGLKNYKAKAKEKKKYANRKEGVYVEDEPEEPDIQNKIDKDEEKEQEMYEANEEERELKEEEESGMNIELAEDEEDDAVPQEEPEPNEEEDDMPEIF